MFSAVVLVGLLQLRLSSCMEEKHLGRRRPSFDQGGLDVKECETVRECGWTRCSRKNYECFQAVNWVATKGLQKTPEKYEGLGYWSTFEDLQMHVYIEGQRGCPMPCPVEIVTTTTTTTTAPPGTPSCPRRAPIPPLPAIATDYNGISWPELCFTGLEEEHAFIIGDWGGIRSRRGHLRPAPNMKNGRGFRWGIDNVAQHLVAKQLNSLANVSRPRYVLNAGDNFYWGGVEEKCGQPMNVSVAKFRNGWGEGATQFYHIFDKIYHGPGIDGVPWLSCLGNHDYGGYLFDNGWDQQFAYTWASDRWVMPGQYFHQHIKYPTKGFSVDVYVVDTNNQDTTNPYADPMHNICSRRNRWSSCLPFGPSNDWDCVTWFRKLWADQLLWLDQKLAASTADWQIIVTHFPPETWTHYGKNVEDWKRLGDKYGIDLMVAAHRHDQEVRPAEDNLVKWKSHIPYIVSGGGGGVTSERFPSDGGWGSGPDQYGFFDMILTKEKLHIIGYNQAGHRRREMTVLPRPRECTATNGTMFSDFYPCLCGGIEKCNVGEKCNHEWKRPKRYWRPRWIWSCDLPPPPTTTPTTTPAVATPDGQTATSTSDGSETTTTVEIQETTTSTEAETATTMMNTLMPPVPIDLRVPDTASCVISSGTSATETTDCTEPLEQESDEEGSQEVDLELLSGMEEEEGVASRRGELLTELHAVEEELQHVVQQIAAGMASTRHTGAPHRNEV
eukprot:CAMPEP_0170592376 /NCGR_PEP_ID=MMETSP0224-20130122/12891_1 /TAXON_ID=285029 /ORGANISM="Togula jolla, Strain CCCM 725" /LENGTH=725 /DNA_ID=CAMNT_0010916277 /DNA_START=50 /DNA_END=2227 /DNA_ORIENTATION=-